MYGRVEALRGASLSVGQGETVALRGSSGSGKSSFLHCLAGIVPPDAGEVSLDGSPVWQLTAEDRARLRREMFGFVFQFGELVPELTLVENVALPLRFSGVSRRGAEARAADLLGALGIGDLVHRRPAAVSGGEMQRAAIARALVHEPRVIFADEPTGALDQHTGDVVLNELLARSQQQGSSVVIVTHDDRVAKRADRIVTMVDGVTDDPSTAAQ